MTQDKLIKIANKLLKNQERLDTIICDLAGDESYAKEYRQALHKISSAVISLEEAENILLDLTEEKPFEGIEYLHDPAPRKTPAGFDLEGKLVGQGFRSSMMDREAAASARLDRDESGRPMTRSEGDGYEGQEQQNPSKRGELSKFVPFVRL